MICAFQPYGFIVVSHWLSMCWLILANLDEELPKQEDVCDTSKDTEHNMNVCILCIVEQRRKSWSIHIFNNVYWHTSVCSSWLVGCCICIHTKNSCRILCISYVHFICNHCLHSDRRRYLYCYLLLPVRTYTDTYILI